MLEYDRINAGERIGVYKTNASKECDIYHYWHFLDKGFKSEQYVCNSCHNLTLKAMRFNDVAVVSI